MRQVHDAFVKRVFSDRRVAAAELRAVLPPALSARLDFRTLRVVKGSFVNKVLRSKHTDILYAISFKGTGAIAYVLLEHQRRVDTDMPGRVLEYIVRIWEDWRLHHPRGSTRPVVIPIILHQGTKPWTGPTRLTGFNAPSDLLPLLSALLPHFELLYFDDLGAISEHDIAARDMPVFGRLGLWALRVGAFKKLDTRFFDDRRRDLIELGKTPGGDDALIVVIGYLSRVLGEKSHKELHALVDGTDDPVVQEAFVSIYDSIRRKAIKEGLEQGRELGLEQGRELGLEQGLTAGQARVLLKLLTLRFGAPTEDTRARVAGASGAELEAWTDRILTAASLDELWG